MGRSTASEWANAMGYDTHNALAKVIRRIVNEMVVPVRHGTHGGGGEGDTISTCK